MNSDASAGEDLKSNKREIERERERERDRERERERTRASHKGKQLQN